MRQVSKPFTLQVAAAAITDLRARLVPTRHPDESPLLPWSTGTSVAYLESLIDYWQSGFDWRAWEPKGRDWLPMDSRRSSSPSCWPPTSSRSLPGSVDEYPILRARATRLPSDPEMGGLRRTSRTC